MLSRRPVRYLVGLVLGGCAGLSFTLSVVPTALHLGRIAGQLELTRAVAPLWPWTVLLWASGGLTAAHLGAPRPAAVTLACLGLGSGLLLVLFGPGLTGSTAAFGGAAGVIYGGLAGLILGRVLGPRPAEDRT
ncbi:MAG: hypothetical protein R3D98_05450 [Candidatus Krumholzibacteriia bacterium]